MKGIYVGLVAGLAAVLLLAAGAAISGPSGGDEISGTGTVRFVDLEGGFYGIVSDDGTQYFPVNLPDEFLVNELRVHVEAQVQEDTMTIQMWGTPIRITRIEAIDTTCTSCN